MNNPVYGQFYVNTIKKLTVMFHSRLNYFFFLFEIFLYNPIKIYIARRILFTVNFLITGV